MYRVDWEYIFPMYLCNHIHILATHWEGKPHWRGQRSLKPGSIVRESSWCEKGPWNLSPSLVPIPKCLSLSIWRWRWQVYHSWAPRQCFSSRGWEHLPQPSVSLQISELSVPQKSQSQRDTCNPKDGLVGSKGLQNVKQPSQGYEIPHGWPVIPKMGLWAAKAFRMWKSQVRDMKPHTDDQMEWKRWTRRTRESKSTLHPWCGMACSVMSNSLWLRGLKPTRLLCPWNFQNKNTRAGCHFLLQGGSSRPRDWTCLLHLLHCRWVLYHRVTRESPFLPLLSTLAGLQSSEWWSARFAVEIVTN